MRSDCVTLHPWTCVRCVMSTCVLVKFLLLKLAFHIVFTRPYAATASHSSWLTSWCRFNCVGKWCHKGELVTQRQQPQVGEMFIIESDLFSVLHLLGWERGPSFLHRSIISRIKAKAIQPKLKINVNIRTVHFQSSRPFRHVLNIHVYYIQFLFDICVQGVKAFGQSFNGFEHWVLVICKQSRQNKS